jgi:hypothetical protein
MRLGPVNCPVCRKKFALSAEDLNVCIRLRDTVEEQFPKKTAERRAEVKQQQDAAAAAAAARAAQAGAGSDSDDDDFVSAFLAQIRRHRAAQAAGGGAARQAGAQPDGFVFGLGAQYFPAPAWAQPPAQPTPAAARLAPSLASLQALPSSGAGIQWPWGPSTARFMTQHHQPLALALAQVRSVANTKLQSSQ